MCNKYLDLFISFNLVSAFSVLIGIHTQNKQIQSKGNHTIRAFAYYYDCTEFVAFRSLFF